MGARLLLRWSVRDLRRRWVQVAVIALVVAIGTGVFAALGSTATWRRQSNDASFERLAMYDVRIRVADGIDAPEGSLSSALAALPDPAIVQTAEERLVLATQVDASTDGGAILVPGRIVGVDVRDGGPHVNGLLVEPGDGRSLRPTDAGDPLVLLERSFARFHDLPDEGRIAVAGGHPVRYVGLAMAPEYFIVIAEEGGFFGQAGFSVLFTSLETAQALTDHAGRVNDLVIRFAPGIDVPAAARTVERTLRAVRPELGVMMMERRDEDAYRLLYDDIDGDQQLWNAFAVLILVGASLGAFNLASRMVDAQRREIGIGMALGARPRQLAVRPLLVGLEIALLGAALGVAVGALAIAGLRPVYTSLLPLPIWHTPLQWSTFARGAAIGFVLPLVATAWPVVRAIRVSPVEAIATTHRPGRGGVARVLRRLPRPVSAFRRMPIGNVLRAPRRTLLTVLGLGAALSTLVALLGILDSFLATVDRGEREQLQVHPDRVAVQLDGLPALDDPVVRAVAATAAVGRIETVLRIGARVGEIDLVIEALDLESDIWAPTFVEGSAAGGGLVLAEKAAADLGVGPGDRVTVEHPSRTERGLVMARTEVRVAGIHPGPFRFNAYLDSSHLDRLGAEGSTNLLYVLPAAGSTPDDVQRQLFAIPGVTAVQAVATGTRVLRDSLDEFTAVFRAIEGFILLLALLMAYNATSINADERARERATLFAFGLPVRRIVGLESVEGIIVGVLGTAVGVAGGLSVLHWLVTNVTARTLPELSLDAALSAGTVLTAAVLGVLAVALAPLLTVRRLRRMDIPGTLRVVE